MERVGQFEFEAPRMDTKTKLKSGCLHRIRIGKLRMKKVISQTSGLQICSHPSALYPRAYRSMIVIESYLNPTPGSRNLEYDPAKTIKPQK